MYQFGTPFFFVGRRPFEGPHNTKVPYVASLMVRSPYTVPFTTRSLIANVPVRDSCRSKALRGTTQHQCPIVASLMVRSPYKVPATTRSPIVNVPDRDSCRSKALRWDHTTPMSHSGFFDGSEPLQSASYNTKSHSECARSGLLSLEGPSMGPHNTNVP